MRPICRVTSVHVVRPYTLELVFDDGSERRVDLEPVLQGELYGPLRDADLFARVTVDAEAHTVVWPNGADFDPAILHDWPEHEAAFIEQAKRWQHARSA